MNQSLTVFYSWQSDTPSNLNRNFIEAALERAIKNLGSNAELSAAARVELDKDTKNVPGSPAIAEAILDKIGACSVFVADLTLVGESLGCLMEKGESPRRFSNPNVLIEYGYALRALTDRSIVAVMNTAYGDPQELPFDIQQKRWPIRYDLREPQDPEKSKKLEELSSQFEDALRPILDNKLSQLARAQKKQGKEEMQKATAILEETAKKWEREGMYLSHPHMLIAAIAEKSLEDEEDWDHNKAYEVVRGLHWGQVTHYGQKQLNNDWVGTEGVFSNRVDQPRTVTRIWSNWAITAMGQFWMYQNPGKPGYRRCFIARSWEDSLIAFVQQLVERMRRKWPESRLFIRLCTKGMLGHVALYDHDPLYLLDSPGEARFHRDTESKVVVIEPAGALSVEPLISTIWLNLGISQSPRHKELFPEDVSAS